MYYALIIIIALFVVIYLIYRYNKGWKIAWAKLDIHDPDSYRPKKILHIEFRNGKIKSYINGSWSYDWTDIDTGKSVDHDTGKNFGSIVEYIKLYGEYDPKRSNIK